MRLRRKTGTTSLFIIIHLATTGGSGGIMCNTLLLATAARLELLEEVVALIVYKDECREVLNFNLPNGFHTYFGEFHALDALD